VSLPLGGLTRRFLEPVVFFSIGFAVQLKEECFLSGGFGVGGRGDMMRGLFGTRRTSFKR